MPHELVRAIDGTLIHNFEVPVEPDSPVYRGGVRGLRAMKKKPQESIPEEDKN